MNRLDWVSGEPRLQLLECRRCAQRFYLPAEFCRRCSGELDIINSNGRGECIAITRIPEKYGHTNRDVFLALVRLDEGPVILTQRSTRVAIGDTVRLEFQRALDEALRPVAVTQS